VPERQHVKLTRAWEILHRTAYILTKLASRSPTVSVMCVEYIVVNKAPPPSCLLSVGTVVAGLIVLEAIGTLASFVCAPGTCHRLLPSCNIANHWINTITRLLSANRHDRKIALFTGCYQATRLPTMLRTCKETLYLQIDPCRVVLCRVIFLQDCCLVFNGDAHMRNEAFSPS
jgi:hypothetical protein